MAASPCRRRATSRATRRARRAPGRSRSACRAGCMPSTTLRASRLRVPAVEVLVDELLEDPLLEADARRDDRRRLEEPRRRGGRSTPPGRSCRRGRGGGRRLSRRSSGGHREELAEQRASSRATSTARGVAGVAALRRAELGERVDAAARPDDDARRAASSRCGTRLGERAVDRPRRAASAARDRPPRTPAQVHLEQADRPDAERDRADAPARGRGR